MPQPIQARLGIPLLLSGVIGCAAPPPPTVGAALSSGFADAARLAIEDRRIPGLDTIFLRDNSSRAEPAIAAAESFISRRGIVGVVAHSNSAASMAAAPLYNARQVVQIAPTSTADRFAEAGAYSFRLVPADREQGAVLAGALSANWPVGTRVALFYVNDDYGRGLRNNLLAHLDTTQRPIVYDLPHADRTLQVSAEAFGAGVEPEVRAAAATRPDLIVWLGRTSTLNAYLPPIRAALGGIPIVGSDGLSGGERVSSGPMDWEGIWHVDYFDMADEGALRSFMARYRARFDRPATPGEVLSYDAMTLLLTAIDEGARTGEEVRAWLMELGRSRPPFPGVSGPIAFDPEGQVQRSFVVSRRSPAR